MHPALDRFDAELAALPDRHPRRIGLWLMRVGVMALVAGIPFSLALMNIGLGTALAGAVLARAPLHILPGFWFGVAFAGWQAISLGVMLAAVPADAARPRLIGLGLMYTWLTLYPALVVLRDDLWRRRAFRVLVPILVAVAALALAQAVLGRPTPTAPLASLPADASWLDRIWAKAIWPGPWRIRPGGEHIGSGFMSVHLTFGYVAGLLLCLQVHARDRLGLGPRLAWTGRLAAAVAVAVSASRLALLAAIAGLAAGFAARGRRWLVAAAGVVVVGMILAATVMWLFQPGKLDNLLRGDDGRWPIWRKAAVIAAEHPWFGVGSSDAYRKADLELNQRLFPGKEMEFGVKGAPHAHHTALGIAAVHGIPAAVLYCALLLALLLAAWRRRLADPLGWRLACGLIAATVVAGQFERVASGGEGMMAFATLLAVALLGNAKKTVPAL